MATWRGKDESGKLVRLLLASSCGCLMVVALTHVAERMHILPRMGWGLPNSPGHYLDLFSAITGVVLLMTAAIVRLLPEVRAKALAERFRIGAVVAIYRARGAGCGCGPQRFRKVITFVN